jgi:hypothetical protein
MHVGKLSLSVLLPVFLGGNVLAAPVGAGLPQGERPRVVPHPIVSAGESMTARDNHGPRHRILYLNKGGGTYSQGNTDNSSTGESRIPNKTGTLAAFAYGDEAWQQVRTCVDEVFAPFAVTITETRPPAEVAYMEAVVAGSPLDIGLADDVGGIAPIPSDRCNAVAERGISFTFSEIWTLGGVPMIEDICSTIAQETAHLFGLDHEFHCPDVMTYLYDCGRKTFVDIDAQCGEDEPRSCKCGTTRQNSYQLMLEALGPADAVPPEVLVTIPEDGATVEQRFEIAASASDNIRVDRVELWIDGAQVDSATGPFRFNAPGLSGGAHTIEVRAVDGDENVTMDSVTVTVTAECSGDGDCGFGGRCTTSFCLWGVNATCNGHEDCQSALCFYDANENASYCTAACTDGDDCPTGTICEGTTTKKCIRGVAAEPGCAAAPGARAGSLGALVLLGLVLALRRKKQ